MRKTTRKIQRVNFIPSKLQAGSSYRKEINLLIEDPLPKDSKESYFIQFSDFVSYFTYLRSVKILGVDDWANRLGWLTDGDVEEILNYLKPVLNLKANSGNHEYGFVVYPR